VHGDAFCKFATLVEKGNGLHSSGTVLNSRRGNMRIALIRQRFEIGVGGAEKYALEMARSMRKAGHEVHIYAQRWDKELEKEGMPIHPIPVFGPFALTRMLSFTIFCERKVKRADYDIVFSHQPLSQQDVTFSGCHRAWLEQRKRYLPAWKRLTPLLNLMHPITLGLESRALSPERTGLVIAHSEFVKREIIRQYGFPAERIRVVHNGINWQRFSTIARSSRIGERFVLLYAGSGFERKGLGYCIRALAKLPKSTDLLVVGNGRFAPYKKLAEKLGVGDQVKYLGTTSRIEEVYARADLLVHPAIYEPFGLVCVEALASGLPVVTSRFTGAAEILTPGVDGAVVDDPSDSEALANAIRDFLDYQRLAAASIAARKKAQSFSLEIAIEKILDVLQSAYEMKVQKKF